MTFLTNQLVLQRNYVLIMGLGKMGKGGAVRKSYYTWSRDARGRSLRPLSIGERKAAEISGP